VRHAPLVALLLIFTLLIYLGYSHTKAAPSIFVFTHSTQLDNTTTMSASTLLFGSLCTSSDATSTIPIETPSCDLSSGFWPLSAGANYDWQKTEWHSEAILQNIGAFKYPLNSAILKRSYTPPGGPAQCAWSSFAAAAEAGAHLNIAVVGGSMTAGYLSLFPWSLFVGEWLARARPTWNITIHNIAIHGCGARCWTGHSLGAYDAYIVDTVINSQGEPPGVNTEAVDALITLLLRIRPTLLSPHAPAILYLETFDIPKRAAWSIGVTETVVFRHYGLPMASYRSAVWPEFDHPPVDINKFWRASHHPGTLTHELVSDVVKYALAHLLLPPSLLPLFCSSHSLNSPACLSQIAHSNCIGSNDRFRPTHFGSLQDASPFCSTRSAESGGVDAQWQPSIAAPPLAPLFFTKGWTFYEDRPGRPGWISNQTNSSISFNVSFDATTPRLELTVVRSPRDYADGWVTLSQGGVEVPQNSTIPPAGAEPPLRGFWGTQYTLPDVTIWEGGSNAWRIDPRGGYSQRPFSWQVKPGVAYEVNIQARSQGLKLKIVAVSGC
jgi:hypothetical protein